METGCARGDVRWCRHCEECGGRRWKKERWSWGVRWEVFDGLDQGSPLAAGPQAWKLLPCFVTAVVGGVSTLCEQRTERKCVQKCQPFSEVDQTRRAMPSLAVARPSCITADSTSPRLIYCLRALPCVGAATAYTLTVVCRILLADVDSSLTYHYPP